MAIDPACLRYGSFDPGPEIRLTIFSDAPLILLFPNAIALKNFTLSLS